MLKRKLIGTKSKTVAPSKTAFWGAEDDTSLSPTRPSLQRSPPEQTHSFPESFSSIDLVFFLIYIFKNDMFFWEAGILIACSPLRCWSSPAPPSSRWRRRLRRQTAFFEKEKKSEIMWENSFSNLKIDLGASHFPDLLHHLGAQVEGHYGQANF